MPKWVRAVVAVAVGFAAATGPAVAADVYVSFMSLPFYETVDLAGGRLGAYDGVYAGQQVLTANGGSLFNPLATYTLDAWCVDFAHEITIGANGIDYTLSTLTDDHLGATPAGSGVLTPATAQELAGLAAYGNALMQARPSNRISASVQVALWNLEYGSHYAGSDTALAAEVVSLMALAPSLSSPSGVLLDSFDASGRFYQSQSLLFIGSAGGSTTSSEAVIAEPGTAWLLAIGIIAMLLPMRFAARRSGRFRTR